MKALQVSATWDPRPNSEPNPRDSREKSFAQVATRVWRNPKLQLVRKPKPQITKPTELLIRVRACGLCGSDVHMAAADDDGWMQYPFMVTSPHVPGHEFCGEVVEWGKAVAEKRPELAVTGRLVTTQCVMPCFECKACIVGNIDNCSYVEERGLTLDGGMAEYCVIDSRHSWSLAPIQERYKSLDSSVSWTVGSLIEPLTGVYKAFTAKGIEFKLGQSVLIIGAGPIGLAALLVAKAMGAGKIMVAEVSRERRVYANRLGASLAFCPVEHKLSEMVLDETHGDGPYFVIEAAGHAEKNWQELGRLFRRQALVPRLIFFGQSRVNISLDPQLCVQRFAVVTGMHGHTKVWEDIISAVGAGRIDPLPLSTQQIGLVDAPEWLSTLRTDKKEGKVTIVFP